MSGKSELLYCSLAPFMRQGWVDISLISSPPICPFPSPQALAYPFLPAWNPMSVVKCCNKIPFGIPPPRVTYEPTAFLVRFKVNKGGSIFTPSSSNKNQKPYPVKKLPGPLVLIYGQERKRGVVCSLFSSGPGRRDLTWQDNQVLKHQLSGDFSPDLAHRLSSSLQLPNI